ncbi:MAG: pilus assembly protein TadG-related protein [Anaerolineales bacterium]
MLKPSERGQSLVLWSLVLLLVILPMMALAIDQGSLYWSRRSRQKLVDAACLDGAIANRLGFDSRTAAINSLQSHGLDSSLWDPQVGTGTDLSVGVEQGVGELRVAVWGETLSWFSQFIPGWNGWEIGARARCDYGLVGPLPLALKECELASGATTCVEPDGTTNYAPGWSWGDEMDLAGQQHDPNISTGMSFGGLIAPDIRCLNDDDECAAKEWYPPVTDGTSSNTVKSITMDYILNGGYNGPAPTPGENIAALDGVSNQQLASAIDTVADVGDILFVMVYETGEVHDGNANYDYVEIVGYTFVRVTQIFTNNIKVEPIDIGTCNTGDTPEDDILTSPDGSPFNIKPVLLPWDYGSGGAESIYTGPTCS